MPVTVHPAPANGTSDVLASIAYLPPTETTKTTASASLVDIDAVNLAVTFTVPASGIVKVEASLVVRGNTLSSKPALGLREGSSDVPGSAKTAMIARIANEMVSFRYSAVFTGLTPGDEKTWKLAIKDTAASGVTAVYGGEWGQAIIEVTSPPF